MAYYLVKAKLKENLIGEIKIQLHNKEFEKLQPFGKALTFSLKNAKIDGELLVWEEEDYCTPPLAQEKEAVLDKYFEIISIEKVNPGKGWERINNLPHFYRNP